MISRPSPSLPQAQRGSVLLFGLVMLVILTMIALTAINTSSGNLRIIGNMQTQQEATDAAQAAINQVLSSKSYFEDPSTVPNSLTINVGGSDYEVTLAKPCLMASTPQPRSDFPNGGPCVGSAKVDLSGDDTQRSNSALSDCSKVTWLIKATAHGVDTTNATVEINQGAYQSLATANALAMITDSTKRCTGY